MIVAHHGDTHTTWPATIERGGTAVDLTGCTVTFRMRERNESTWKILDGAVTIVNAAAGEVEYQPNIDGSDTDTGGVFYARWKVTHPSGRVDFYPTMAPDIVQITGPLVAT